MKQGNTISPIYGKGLCKTKQARHRDALAKKREIKDTTKIELGVRELFFWNLLDGMKAGEKVHIRPNDFPGEPIEGVFRMFIGLIHTHFTHPIMRGDPLGLKSPFYIHIHRLEADPDNKFTMKLHGSRNFKSFVKQGEISSFTIFRLI